MPDQVVPITSAADAAKHAFAPGVSPLDPAAWARHGPFVHFLSVRDGRCVGRCSAWSRQTPNLNGTPAGVVGHYAAVDAAAGTAVLQLATTALAAAGLATAVGPMDGNTWRHYRLVTGRGDEPPFFLEPENPDDWPGHFIAAGFAPVASYSSAVNDDLTVTDPRVPRTLARLAADGVRIRPIDLGTYADEMAAVHDLSTEAFAQNYLYTPIGREEFVAMYAPLRGLIRPDLVLLAERAGQLVGFVFGLPDLLEVKRGQPPRTAIAKSLAVRPGRAAAGLGSVLLDQFQQAARRAGFTRVIHALMHDDNTSVNVSGRFGRPMRQYTLYSKVVRP